MPWIELISRSCAGLTGNLYAIDINIETVGGEGLTLILLS